MRLLLAFIIGLSLVCLFFIYRAFPAEPCITHKFVSAKSDGSDTSVVRPSNWNQCHAEPPKVITFGIGSPGVLMADTDDYPDIWLNDTQRTLTITQVTCRSDAGSPTIQLQRDDGSATNMFSSNMTCVTSPSGTDGTNGILTSFVSGENVLSPGHWLNYLTIAAGGSAHMITVSIQATVGSGDPN